MPIGIYNHRNTKTPTVHHIDYDKKNSNPKNLITLCVSCNFKVNFERSYWENYFKSLETK
jgi:5-methylcytosine-specific restriction endonuclease McrA